MTITTLLPAPGKLTFTGLGPNNADLYLLLDLLDFHVGHRSRGAFDICADGLLVSRCVSCGAPIEFIGAPECEHTGRPGGPADRRARAYAVPAVVAREGRAPRRLRPVR
jgi:hypothetical protein